ncbi:MAG: uroporphyrinogen decarboxylase family protein [Armatimonadota bacterium]
MPSPREVVAQALRFASPERLPYELPDPYGSDIFWTNVTPSPDARYGNGVDEWGAVWENIGIGWMGEVKEPPLKEWADFDKLPIPDVRAPHRWEFLDGLRERAGDRFIMGHSVSLYERIHFLRGLENTWADIYEAPEELERLIDMLVDMDLYIIERYAAAGVDGFFMGDDWGLQDRLMIRPEKWREIWKPRYAKVFAAAHDAGMFTLLHSCGYIVDILDDLIEVGLDAVHMDQQENMGLELLSERFGGRITFYVPVDIQQTMCKGTPDDVRAYARKMVRLLGRPEGGIIVRSYGDPTGAGHSQENMDAMCTEFLQMNEEMRTGAWSWV